MNFMHLMPGLELEEIAFLKGLLKGMNDQQVEQFAMGYRARRIDPQTVLITALVGFLGVSGIHRFLLGQIGMGILYFFTGGLCLVGTIIDLVNYKTLTLEYNRIVAQEIASMLRM